MKVFPDTSFLCGLYIPQSTSRRAIDFMGRQREPLVVSSLLLFEFRQSTQFQVFRFAADRSERFSNQAAQAALQALQSDLKAGAFELAEVDWADVHQQAERLALQHTRTGGHRSLDVLHVATALHLGAGSFVTFDRRQRSLARAEGLAVPV